METAFGSRLVYTAGPWYWVHVIYSYSLVLLVGTMLLARGVRRFPPCAASNRARHCRRHRAVDRQLLYP